MSKPGKRTDRDVRLWARLCLSGPMASVLFALSLIGFAAVRTDGYTHGTKAISELGAAGAPNALAFNVLGFILPGALTVLLAVSLLKLKRVQSKRIGPVLLMLAGVCFAAAGIFPVNLAARASPVSVLHALGAMLTGLFWGLSLFWLGAYLKTNFGMKYWGQTTPWFIAFLIANLVWQGIWQTSGAVLPGWGQRIAFAGYYSWLATTGWLVFRQAGGDHAPG